MEEHADPGGTGVAVLCRVGVLLGAVVGVRVGVAAAVRVAVTGTDVGVEVLTTVGVAGIAVKVADGKGVLVDVAAATLVVVGSGDFVGVGGAEVGSAGGGGEGRFPVVGVLVGVGSAARVTTKVPSHRELSDRLTPRTTLSGTRTVTFTFVDPGGKTGVTTAWNFAEADILARERLSTLVVNDSIDPFNTRSFD